MNSDLHNEFRRVDAAVDIESEADWHEDDLGFFGAMKRFFRYSAVMLFSAIAFLLLGALYLFFASVEYRATATVMFVPDLDQFRNQALFNIDIETHSVLIESDEILSLVLDQSPISLSGQGEGLAVSRLNDIRGAFERPPLTVTDEALEASRDDNAAPGASAESIGQTKDPVLLSELRERVEVERVGASKLLNVSFSASDAAVAVTMANTLAEVYSENAISANMRSDVSPASLLVQDLLQNRGVSEGTGPTVTSEASPEQRNVQVVKLATLASAQSSPNVNIVLAVSVMIGMIVGLTIAAGLEFRKKKLRFET